MKNLETIKETIKFFADALRESDGNGGGKPSYSKMLGVYVVVHVVNMAWYALGNPSYHIPEQIMVLFWVLVGYQIIAKLLSTMSPAVLDIARAFLLKAGATVTLPVPVNVKADTTITKTTTETVTQ